MNRTSPISSGTQAPWMNLVRFAAEERELHGEEQPRPQKREPERPSPAATDDDEEEDRRDHDRPGHRHPEGERELRGALEREHQRQHGSQQQPVDDRHVDLPVLALRGVDHAQAREVAELRRLVGEREGAGDHRLRGDNGGRGRQDDKRDQAAVRHEPEERGADRVGVVEDQRSLAEVAEDAGRKDEQQPGASDRGTAEMTHVGIERLDAGDRQHHRGEREEAVDPLWKRKSKA